MAEQRINSNIDYVEEGRKRIMDALFCEHLRHCRTDSHEMQWAYDCLNHSICDLKLCEYDQIWNAVCTLCTEHEYRGFCAGMRTGGFLMKELLPGEVKTDA